MLWWTLRKMRSRDALSRLEAVDALRGRRDPRAIEALTKGLFDDDEVVRRQSARALAAVGWQPTESQSPVCDLNDPKRRVYALDALAALGWRAPEPGLRATLAVIAGRFEEAIAEGTHAVDPLIDALEKGVEGAIPALAQIGDTRAIAPLMRSLKQLPIAVADALISFGPVAVDGLMSGLKSPDAKVRRLAASTLGRIKDHQAVEASIEALSKAAVDDFDLKVRSAALDSLLASQNPTAVLAGQKILARQRARYPLVEVTALVRKFKGSFKGGYECGPLRELKQVVIKDPQAIAYLCRFVLEESPGGCSNEAHRALCQKVISLGPSAVDHLILALQAEHHRDRAIELLGEIGDERAVEPLLRLLGEHCFYASRALGRIGSPRAAPGLVEQLQKHQTDEILGENRQDLCQSEGALRLILERAPERIESEVLRAISELRNIRWGVSYAASGAEADIGVVDVTYIKRLAQQELTRRGRQ
jgi:HEAT repeat protein